MNDLILKILNLLQDDRINKIIGLRIKEFNSIIKEGPKRIFMELSFCILTANYRADKAIYIQRNIWDGFLTLDLDTLSNILKLYGYRYPYTRARYIVDAREKIIEILNIINEEDDQRAMRDRLSKLVKGLGYKEASHFLRNIGFYKLAILDRHIIKLLARHGYIPFIYRLNKRAYLDTEEKYIKLSKEVDLEPGILDLYLWYIETGKILK